MFVPQYEYYEGKTECVSSQYKKGKCGEVHITEEVEKGGEERGRGDQECHVLVPRRRRRRERRGTKWMVVVAEVEAAAGFFCRYSLPVHPEVESGTKFAKGENRKFSP